MPVVFRSSRACAYQSMHNVEEICRSRWRKWIHYMYPRWYRNFL